MASCELYAGYEILCQDAVGGVDAVYLMEFSNVEAINDVSGVVTGITKASGKRFWQFQLPTKSSAIASANPVTSIENGTRFWEHRVEFPINKRDITTRNLVDVLTKVPVVAVTKDKDGVYRLYGRYGGLFNEGSSGTTGSAAGDANGYKIGLSGTEREDFVVLNDAVAAALETAG